MKRYTLIISSVLLTNYALSSSSNPPTFIIHNHVGGPSVQTSAELGVDFKQKNNALPNQATYDTFKKNIPACYDFFLRHKYQNIIGIALASVAHISYKIYNIHKILQNQASWCNWKATASLQQLSNAHYDELTPDLINDIQKKYLLKTKTSANNVSTSPFDEFIKDAAQEIKMLEWYIAIQKIAKKTYTSSFFYFDYKKSFVQEKINRIHITLDIFISWQTKSLLK